MKYGCRHDGMTIGWIWMFDNQMKISNFKWFTAARGELENWRNERALATNVKGLNLEEIVVTT